MTGYEHPAVASLLRQFNTKYTHVSHEDVSYVLGLLAAVTRTQELDEDVHEPRFGYHQLEGPCAICDCGKSPRKRHVSGLLEVCFWDGVSVSVTPPRHFRPETFVAHCKGLRALRSYCFMFERAAVDECADLGTLDQLADGVEAIGCTALRNVLLPHLVIYSEQHKIGFARRLPHLRWAPYVTLYCGAKKALGEEPRLRQADEDARAAAFEPAQDPRS